MVRRRRIEWQTKQRGKSRKGGVAADERRISACRGGMTLAQWRALISTAAPAALWRSGGISV